MMPLNMLSTGVEICGNWRLHGIVLAANIGHECEVAVIGKAS